MIRILPKSPPTFDQHMTERGRSVRRTVQSGKFTRRHDAATIMLAWGLSLCLSLLVQPHYGETSTYELLYYSFYNVAVGAVVGFFLFDRLPKDGFALFALRAASAILFGTLVNEAVLERFVFGTGPINGVGVYYGLTDSLSWTAIFLLLRLAEWLRVPQEHLSSELETRTGPDVSGASSKLTDANASCLFVRVANGTHRIYAPDVIYMAAERDFTRIVCMNGEYFVSENLKSLLNRSSKFGLIRVHKSFAVNVRRVERLTRTEVQLGERRVPVGRRYYPALAEIWRSQSAPFTAH